MEERLNYSMVAPDAIKAMYELEKYEHDSGLERSLYELVKTRASQINGCAYCIDMHTKDARKAGETEQRLYALNAWRETPFYTQRERAALAWTEALTLISENDVSGSLYESARKHFDEKEMIALTMAIVAIIVSFIFSIWHFITVKIILFYPFIDNYHHKDIVSRVR